MMPPWYFRAWLALWNAPGQTASAMLKAGALSLWLTAGAAMAWTVVSVCYVRMFGDRLTPDQAADVILSAHLLVGLAILAITGREISLSITRKGLSANVGKDDVPEAKPPEDGEGELPPDQRVQR